MTSFTFVFEVVDLKRFIPEPQSQSVYLSRGVYLKLFSSQFVCLEFKGKFLHNLHALYIILSSSAFTGGNTIKLSLSLLYHYWDFMKRFIIAIGFQKFTQHSFSHPISPVTTLNMNPTASNRFNWVTSEDAALTSAAAVHTQPWWPVLQACQETHFYFFLSPAFCQILLKCQWLK